MLSREIFNAGSFHDVTKTTALKLDFSLQDLYVGAADRVGQVQGAELKIIINKYEYTVFLIHRISFPLFFHLPLCV